MGRILSYSVRAVLFNKFSAPLYKSLYNLMFNGNNWQEEHCTLIQYVLIHKLFTLGKVGKECHPSILAVEILTV